MDKLSEGKCRRIENALWGLFAGDASAMSAHWFYGTDTLEATFGGGITGYTDAPHPHPESFMVGMEYEPDVGKSEKMGRPYDILHEHSRFYRTTFFRSGNRDGWGRRPARQRGPGQKGTLPLPPRHEGGGKHLREHSWPAC